MSKLFLIAFLLLTINAISQSKVFKYRATFISTKELNSKEDRVWTKCKVLIVVDTANSKITIYNSPKDEYDIIEFIKEENKPEAYYTVSFKSIDKYGRECTMALSSVLNREYNALLIISRNNIGTVYKMMEN